MGEAYDYFAGVDAYAGNNKVKADYTRVFTSGADRRSDLHFAVVP